MIKKPRGLFYTINIAIIQNVITHRRDPYSTEHHFKNYKRKTKSKPPVVKKPNQKKREDRMELFSAQELSKSKLYKYYLLCLIVYIMINAYQINCAKN